MTRELLILRHGKAQPGRGAKDRDRELKDKGKRDIQRIGVWLQENERLPDAILASPAERAWSTAQKSLKAGGAGTEGLSKEERLYDASLKDLKSLLAKASNGTERLMLVGHNPGLKQLAAYLTGSGELLSKGMLLRIGLPDDWGKLKKGCGQLLDRVDPGDLPRLFPFPGPGSSEMRDRPSYYYTQSSVIPYRLHEGAVEILVIQSSKQHHSVVPKGIKEPGLTPQASAAKEAWEEAGVEGYVEDAPLGAYGYEKWGANCTCTVYAMAVRRVVPEAEWKESHRGRVWMPPEEAAARLKQKELGPLVMALAERLRQTS
ncbi:NUDIX domain-containing protein [Magnetospira sp. QH-2]|uniref:NUDIX domain-containing protein n=1 Tax=Magnetospira sp. (strain QH-2) TaxID=1288970 RepID=UPI0003E813E3|nr:NUDIX domain-containing protein [Magnetospira sp. QH-2]CCQ72150.1 putative hydrolase [Magnetospira sp. QH-2]